MPTKKPEDRKAKPRCVKLSQDTEKRLAEAVKDKAAKNITDGIERAVSKWRY